MSQTLKRLPDSELEIMIMIWNAKEPITSAYIYEQLKDKKGWKITSILTFLARLVEKGFISVLRQGKTNIYTALISEQEYLDKESRTFLEKLYGNSLTTFVTSLYRSNAISDNDLTELKQFIDEATKEG